MGLWEKQIVKSFNIDNRHDSLFPFDISQKMYEIFKLIQKANIILQWTLTQSNFIVF